MIMETMAKEPFGDILDRCRMDKCKYCMDFLKRERLFLNDVE